MRRDWTAAREKCDLEAGCRVCHHGPVEAAHIIPRSRVSASVGGPGERPDNIVPLCRDCHSAYDGRRLDLLPYLTRQEQAYAVSLVGLAEAMRRVTSSRLAA